MSNESGKTYVQRNYVVAALPFNHMEVKHYTVFVTCESGNDYVIKDGFRFLITIEGKYDNSGLIQKDSDYYKERCLMGEDEALRVAQSYVKNMLVGGLSAEDVKTCDEMAAAGATIKEINKFRQEVMQSPATREKMRKMFVTAQEVGWELESDR